MTRSRLSLAALATLTLVGGWMRVRQARESLWLDELHTAWCALGSLAEVAPRATIGNQSPLFFWLQWLLVQLLGASELTLRLPSIVAGTLLPAALFFVTRRGTESAWCGLVAAALVVVDPLSIFFATEARPYALIQLLAVLHVGLFAEVLQRPTPRLRLALVAGAALLFHLHYTAILLVAGELVALVLLRLWASKPPEYRGRAAALDLVLIALLCLPAVGNLQAIYTRRHNWAAFVPQRPLESIFTLLPWSGAALFVLAALLHARFAKRAAGDLPPRMAVVALAWLLVPVALAWLATATDAARLFFPRYLASSTPAAIVLAACCVRLAPGKLAPAGLGLALVFAALVGSGTIEQYRRDGRFLDDRRDDWRSAVAFFNRLPNRDRYPVLVRTPLIESDALRYPHDEQLARYCLYPVTSLYPSDTPATNLIPLPRTDAGRLAAGVRSRVVACGGAWLIVGGSQERSRLIERQLLAELRGEEIGTRGQRSEVSGQESSHRWAVRLRRSFGNVHILLLHKP